MPLDSVSLPSIWNIPASVGVPALLGQSIGAGVDASLSTAIAGTYEKWMTSTQSKLWGIYNSSNKQVLTTSRVLSVSYGIVYNTSDAPLEDGGFTSFNKVKTPYQATISVVCDGTESGSSSIVSALESLVGLSSGSSSGINVRSSFIKALETISGDTNLYSIVTPEFTFTNANIIGYSFRREVQSGVTMIICDIGIKEVRKTASLYYVSTKQAQGQAAIQVGTVQTQNPSTAVNSAVAGVRV